MFQGAGGVSAAVGSKSPAGDGRWGHADLGGNAEEWVLDRYDSYVSPCVDCAALTHGVGTNRVLRGGSFFQASGYLAATGRVYLTPNNHTREMGVRCARSP